MTTMCPIIRMCETKVYREYYGVIVYIAIHVILSLCHIQSKIFNMNKQDFVGSVTLLSS